MSNGFSRGVDALMPSLDSPGVVGGRIRNHNEPEYDEALTHLFQLTSLCSFEPRDHGQGSHTTSV